MTRVFEILASEIEAHLNDLCSILIDSVADGAAISFMDPVSREDARSFWSGPVRSDVAQGNRHLLGADIDDQMVGTVQLVVGMPPNQPHRAEISKMIVHPGARRRGVAKALMIAALDLARAKGKTLVTLDTRTGDVSEALYWSVGFEVAGAIPGFALDPDGTALHATTYMFKELTNVG